MAATGVGIGMASGSARGYIKEPDYDDGSSDGAGSDGGDDSDHDRYKPDWFAFPAQHDPWQKFNYGPLRGTTRPHTSYGPVNPAAESSDHTWPEFHTDITADDELIHSYSLRGGNKDYQQYDTDISRGDSVVVWVHGWQNGGLSIFSDAGSATGSVKYGITTQSPDAWWAIDGETELGRMIRGDDSRHAIGWCWNSRSAAANFNGAVGQAHAQGPQNLATFLYHLSGKVGSGGTIHIGAHSLGAWHSLEAFAHLHTVLDRNWEWWRADAFQSLRFICGAVPESALGHNGGDPNWINWSHTYRPHANETYDKHALKIPNKIINNWYKCDSVVDCRCCEWWVSASPFQQYLKNYGSSSDGIGAHPVQAGSDVEDKFWNREAWHVKKHTGSYKHQNHENNKTGGGQWTVWHEWADYPAYESDDGDVDCGPDIPYPTSYGGGSSTPETMVYTGAGGGGGGDGGGSTGFETAALEECDPGTNWDGYRDESLQSTPPL